MKNWRITYITERYVGKHPVKCYNTLFVEGEKIEEVIATTRNQLGPDTKIVRCEAGIEVYK